MTTIASNIYQASRVAAALGFIAVFIIYLRIYGADIVDTRFERTTTFIGGGIGTALLGGFFAFAPMIFLEEEQNLGFFVWAFYIAVLIKVATV